MTTTVRCYPISLHNVLSEPTKLVVAGSLSRSLKKYYIEISQMLFEGYWFQVLTVLRILLL